MLEGDIAAPQPSFFAGRGNYYEFVAGRYTHGEAVAEAMSRQFRGAQGHLATITSAEEDAFVFSLMSGDASAWIGGERIGDEWAWVETEEGVFWRGNSPGTAVPGAYAN